MDQSRRKILKLLAATPLYLTFGFAGAALMRFAKPSMSPLGVFDAADEPEQTMNALFTKDYFPAPWTCLPFMYDMKIKVFSPQQEEIQSIPGFIVRLADDQIVAYSRECPRGKGCFLNFVLEPRKYYSADLDNPALVCCCHIDIYDLANDAINLQCPLRKRPKQFEVIVQGEKITIGRLDSAIV